MTTARDEQLSALLDGALAAAEERALREEIARDPALAARLEVLARVDAALRAIPERPVPADLRARLQARLAADERAHPPLRDVRGTAPRRPRISLRAWGAGFTAAAAAALVAVIGLPNADSQQRRDTQLADAPVQRESATSAEAATALPVDEIAAVASSEIASSEVASAPSEPSSGALLAEPALQIASAAAAPSASDAAAVAVAEERADSSELDLEAEFAATELAAEPVEEIEIEGGPLTLLVEMNDDEHAALAVLALEDASVVDVLGVLDALGALEGEAS
jgi:hypothetical protein